jgi:hypothetical protein
MLMWTQCKICEACQNARATVEIQSGFFLCDECEAVVAIEFREFELPPRRRLLIERPPQLAASFILSKASFVSSWHEPEQPDRSDDVR